MLRSLEAPFDWESRRIAAIARPSECRGVLHRLMCVFTDYEVTVPTGLIHALPDSCALRGCAPHRLVRFDVESMIEVGDIGQRADHPPLGRGVHVAE